MDDIAELSLGDQFFVVVVSKSQATRTPYKVTSVKQELGAHDRPWIVVRATRLDEASAPIMNMLHISHTSNDMEITLQKKLEPDKQPQE